MLPNTSALNQAAAAAPPPPQSAASSEVHGLPDLVRTVMAHLGASDDPGAACRAVADFCALDSAHRAGCQATGNPTDPRNPWRLVTNRVFRSTAGDRALFAHEALLETDPKAAFQQACYDRQMARVAALDFVDHGLYRVNREMFSGWENALLEHDGDLRRHQQNEGMTPEEIYVEFHEEHPVTSKVASWRLVAQDEYKRCGENARHAYERDIQPKFPDGILGWLGRAATGMYLTQGEAPGTTLMGILRSDEDSSLFSRDRSTLPLAQVLAEADRSLHALAERVGRATVWSYHTDTGSQVDPGGRDAKAYVLSAARVLV